MNIEFGVVWFGDQFNISLKKPGEADAFCTMKGFRIVAGNDGDFVGVPSSKGKNDKWWRHVWLEEGFQGYVMKLAKESRPVQEANPGSGPDGMDDSEIPF